MIRSFIIGFTLLVGVFSQAQFTLSVTPTPETCFGNGEIDVSVSGVPSGATVDYVLYKLPDLTTPVATAVGGPPPNYPFTFQGLTDGTYKVVATQSSGGQSSSEEENVIVVDNKNPVTPPTTNISHTILCGDDGKITIDVTQGTVSTYELLEQQPDGSFSQIFPPQTGNTFSGLTPGVYVISMVDALCLNTVNMTYTIAGITLEDVEFLGYEAEPDFGDDCTASAVAIKQGIQIPLDAFPVTITFITYPPGGGIPVEQTQIIPSPGGLDPAQIIVAQNIPYYPGTYFFNVVVTNACGSLYTFDTGDQPVNFEMSVTAKIAEAICHGIDVTVENFQGGSYSVIFLEHPPLFVPTVAGDTSPPPHEGPFTEPKTTFGTFNFYQQDGAGNLILDGSGNPIPELTGYYKIKVIDDCGNEVEFEFDIADEIQDPNLFATPIPPLPNATIPFLDCIDMGILQIQHEINLEEVYIVGGPADFQTFLTDHVGLPQASLTDPIDISAYIAFPPPDTPPTMLIFDGSQGELTAYGDSYPLVGLGVYQIKIIDVCGNEFIKDINLDPYFGQNAAFTVDVSPGCGALSGFDIASVLDEGSGVITAVIVEDAPADFYTQFPWLETSPGVFDALPYKYVVPNNDPTLPPIGHIMMGDLPPGHYEFNIRVSCVFGTFEFDVPAYAQTTDVTITAGCGVFDFKFEHTKNNTPSFLSSEVYILEVFDPQNNTWIEVRNDFKPGDMVYNINLQGQFRIRKQYITYLNDIFTGGAGLKLCQEVLTEFEVVNTPGIKDIYSVSCASGGSEAIVDAEGVQPLTYYIVDDNDNVIINNGQSNVFTNLASGTYRFKIEDNCGSTEFGTHQVDAPVTFAISEFNICDGQNGSISVQCYSIFTYEWYKVENGTETLVGTGCQLDFISFDVNNDSGTYKVKIIYAGDPNSCANQELSYNLQPSQPIAGDDQDVTVCHTDQNIDLFTLLVPPYDSGGIWEDTDGTGALNGSTFTTQGLALGTYTFRYFIGNCTGTAEAFVTITLADVPNLPTIVPVAPLCEGEDLQLSIQGANNQYTYTWTTPNGDTYTGSNIMISGTTSQDQGTYSVVASLGNCSSPIANVSVDMNLIPEFEIFGSTEICIGTPTSLSVQSAFYNVNDATYEWMSNGNVIGTNITLTISDVGDYVVKATLNGCEYSNSVTVIEKNVMDVNLIAGCDAQNQFSIEIFNLNDFSNVTFEWTDPNGSFVSSETSIRLNGLFPLGIYKVKITDSEGCVSTQSIDVTDIDCMIPKGITPNDDGRNDTFDLSNYEVSELKIFNRYGKEVYKASNYTNQWHGQTSDSNKLLPSATYYYIVTFVDGSKKTGWVYLNREE